MRSLSKFFYNHGLLNLIKRPQWYYVIGGSNTYVQKLIKKGIDEGAKLVAGGTGKPEGLNKGYYVKPIKVITFKCF